MNKLYIPLIIAAPVLLAGACAGKKTEAARRLGWTRQKLYRRLAALFPPGFATARRPRQPGFGA